MVLTIFLCFNCYVACLLWGSGVGWLQLTRIHTQFKECMELITTTYFTHSVLETTPTTHLHKLHYSNSSPDDTRSDKKSLQHCRWTAHSNTNTALLTSYTSSESLSCFYSFVYVFGQRPYRCVATNLYNVLYLVNTQQYISTAIFIYTLRSHYGNMFRPRRSSSGQ